MDESLLVGVMQRVRDDGDEFRSFPVVEVLIAARVESDNSSLVVNNVNRAPVASLFD